MCYLKWVLLTSKSLFWRKQTPSIWFGDREMQTYREKTYTRNNSFMNYQQIYSFNQWNDWEEDTFLSTLPENNLKICYRLQNIAILVTERTQLPHPKKNFPRSSPFYRMWRHFSLDDPNTKNVPGVVECSPPPLLQIDHNTGNYVPYCFRQVCRFFNVPCWPCNTEDAGDGAYGLKSLSEKTWMSNHLQI